MRGCSGWLRYGLLGLVGLILFSGFTAWRRETEVPLLPALPQDPLIQVYFNQAQSARYADSYRQQLRLGDDLEQVVIEAIQSAHSSIDIAVQELNLPGIALALAERHRAGVSVRLILENRYSRSPSRLSSSDVAQLDQREQQKYQEWLRLVDANQDGQLAMAELASRDALTILQAAQVPLIDDMADGSKGSGLMHHKAVVIDRQTVILGSANFTLSDMHGDFRFPESRGNANHLLRIHSPALAQHVLQEFDLMWGDGPGRQANSRFGLQKPYRSPHTLTLAPNSTITVQFSPTSTRFPWSQSVNGLIAKILQQASHYVHMALFVFSEQHISNVLEARHRQGVRIRALIDAQFIHRDYSEALDMLGVALANQQCRAEKENRPWSAPITSVGVPSLAAGDLLHHKFAVIDDHTVITGSHNWSAAANHTNDEMLIVIRNATVAAHFQREFDRLYQDARLGISASLQEKLQQQQLRCQS